MYLIILFITIAMSCLKQTISDNVGLNPSVRIHEYNLDDKPMESLALSEGFLLPSNSRIKHSPSTPTLADSSLVNQNFVLNITDIINDGFLNGDDEHLSKELMNIGVTMDGSGDTTEPPTTSVTITSVSITSTSLITNSTTIPSGIVLSGYSTFRIILDCTNANAIFMNILNQFNRTFPYWYNVTYNITGPTCPRSLSTSIFFTFFTGNNITVLTDLIRILESIVSSFGIELNSINPCGIPQTVLVKNPTSCTLIDLCGLCGTNPPRGVCLPEKNLSKCQCFTDENNPSISYIGELCTIPRENEVTMPSWVSIVIGILAGIAGLFCLITIGFLIKFLYHRHSQKSKYSHENEIQFDPQWFTPRVWVSTLNNNPSYQLDDGLLNNSYDPIEELDAIIDNGDIDFTLHESSDWNIPLYTNSRYL